MSDVSVNDMFARIMESIQENTEHLQEYLQAIDERLSAVGRSRGPNRSRVGTIVDTSPHSVAHSVISWDPASTTDSLMSRDPSPSWLYSLTRLSSISIPLTVVLLLLHHSTMLAEVPREKKLLQGCVLPNGASSNEVWLAVPIPVVPTLLSRLPSLQHTHDQRFTLPPHLMFLSFNSMDARQALTTLVLSLHISAQRIYSALVWMTRSPLPFVMLTAS